jgi:uncharacterized protein (DUF1697 family)
MPQYIAFLRAINVGGRVVKMDRLRSLFEGMGFRNVETFIASGNVIFETPGADAAAIERRVERTLEAALGYAVGTFIRSTTELAAVHAHAPFGTPDPATHAYWIGFLKTATAAHRDALLRLRNGEDDFHLHEREAYWIRAGRMSDSKITGAMLEKAIGPATFRNVTTVGKLVEKYPPPGDTKKVAKKVAKKRTR